MKIFASKIEKGLMITDCPMGVDACVGDGHCIHDCPNYIETVCVFRDMIYIKCRAEILEPSMRK